MGGKEERDPLEEARLDRRTSGQIRKGTSAGAEANYCKAATVLALLWPPDSVFGFWERRPNNPEPRTLKPQALQ